jgi:hypothetical protein
MKRLTTIIMLIYLSIGVFQAQEWGYVNTLTDECLHKICTQGLDTVYIVGKNGLIAQSTDQGETWNKQHFPTGVTLNDIIFTDHYNGFAVGEQGTILKTTDAGENWTQVTSGSTSNINAIAATGLDNIWAVGDNSLALHSVDGGDTWEQINILLENDRQLLDIEFRDNLGYFTGNYATVYKTEDYGNSWNKQTIMEESYSIIFRDINIMESKTYMAYGSILLSTIDQMQWMPSHLPTHVANPFFLNDSIGYVSFTELFTGGLGNLCIVKTMNGRFDWENNIEIECPSMQNISSVSSKIKMLNDTLGYAIFSQVLLKIPLSTPLNLTPLQNETNLTITQKNDSELLIQSESYPIASCKIFDISGYKLSGSEWTTPIKETAINISNLSKGVFLIQVLHDNNIVSISKYIKK